ncbi:dipeptidase [Lichenicoccus sp.]|uniref:dipeptidase n=1 Tax=Lichenicoccus sp. TaxID=2781899 RepID=UPI003D0B5343
MTDIAALHRSILTLDSHIDIPWPASEADDPFTESARRRVDLPKMLRGGLRAGCFAAYIPQGSRDAAGYAAASDRALAMLDAIAAMGASRGGIAARLCTSSAQIQAAFAAGVIAIVPAVENGHAIGADLGMLAQLRAKGARYMTMTHNGHNALADSAVPRRDLGDGETLHGGLSPFGREAITEMNRLGMLVDVSHLSRQSMLQAAMHSTTPVVATHSCVRALCDHPRNLDDTQLDALRDTEGLIQITAMPSFLRPKPDSAPASGKTQAAGKHQASAKQQASIGDFVDHLDYVVQRIGVAHAGISSDFDGGGAVAGWSNAGESEAVTAELVRRGYGHAEIAAFWGGNFLRLLRRAERAAEPS